MSAPIGLIIKNSLASMSIGDAIPCRYTAATSGTAGAFSELGTCVATEIPVAGSATPDGLFYFIKADKGLLIADRVLQHSISWDVLHTAKFIHGAYNALFNKSTIAAGSLPKKIWGDATKVYVANYASSGTVTCINRADNTTTTINVGGYPSDIWGDATTVYVANYTSNNVSCIKRSDNTVTTIATCPTPRAIWGDINNVYVVPYSGTYITCIKRSDNTTTNITLPAPYQNLGNDPVYITGDANKIYFCVPGYWVSGYHTYIIGCADRSTGIATSITVGTDPVALYMDATNVYVANYTTNNVTCIKRSDNTTTSIAAGTNPYSICGDSDNVYVANYGANTITIIKKSDKTTSTITVGSGPRAISVDSTNIYVANYGAATLSIINKSTKNITTITTGTSPFSIFNDSNGLYIPNYGSTNVTYVSLPLAQTLIRSLTGGNTFLGSDGKLALTDNNLGAWLPNNEWDTYIVKSNLGGKITIGDNTIWHWSSTYNWCQDTPNPSYSASTSRVSRGLYKLNGLVVDTSSTVGINNAFRPVLEYPEDIHCTNVWY